MSIAIAFLSGKGGSGKTTFALSMANLLYKCGMQTLLVDCDLSTNGATYFYESHLITQDENEQSKLLSFDNLLKKEDVIDELRPLTIEPGLDFIPSVSDISNQYPGNLERMNHNNQAIQLARFLTWARKKYEIILLDCQAGYADFLPMILPLMDVDLFVMETDSISASAMRSLHLKIGNCLGHAKLYQIFNKATPEEFDIYSKIVGTFFTNIGTVLFDWKIRQAFSRSQVPDLEHTSAKYGSDLCEICKIILIDKNIQEKLDRFSAKLSYQQLNEEGEQIMEKLNKSFSFTHYFLLIFSAFVSVFLIFLPKISNFLMPSEDSLFETMSNVSVGVPYMAIVDIALILALTTTITMISLHASSRKEQKEYERRLKEIQRELLKLHVLGFE